MSGPLWKWRRLRAMEPGEVVHRVRIALRDRLAPRAYVGWTPEQAYGRLFATGIDETLERSRLARLVHLPLDAGDLAPVLAAAEALGRGDWKLFGHPVRLADPPLWNRNPLSGAEWPDRLSKSIDYHDATGAGDPKYVWELGRLTPLPLMALAARSTDDPRAAARTLAWLDDWNLRHPLGHGIHHTSGIEMAARVLTVTWTLALLGRRAHVPATRATLGLLAQQSLHGRDHQSLGSSANNHLLAEVAAMTVAGATFPTLRGADGLARSGLAQLSRELLRQIHSDGVPAEQAWGYLPFVWELALAALIACEAAGLEAPAEVRARLGASLEFARTVRRPDGALPQIGDEDDARLLLALEEPSRLDLVGNALAAWLGADALSDHGALARLMVGRAMPARTARDGRHEFAAGGYTVWREQGLLLTFDHGPLGLGSLAAHGHADALSVTLFRGADPIVIDPGTFAYHSDTHVRDSFRGTPAHGTVHFGGRSQSVMWGAFLWGARARVARAGDGYECRWAGGETHARTVRAVEGGFTIEDRVNGKRATLVFPLAPGAVVRLDGTRARVAIGGTIATFESEGLTPWRSEPGEVAPRFGWKTVAPRLVAGFTGTHARTEVRLFGS